MQQLCSWCLTVHAFPTHTQGLVSERTQELASAKEAAAQQQARSQAAIRELSQVCLCVCGRGGKGERRGAGRKVEQTGHVAL
jgi:hypothetical protein